jgi:hypothetical protein
MLAQRLALPKPDEKPMTWWRRLPTTGCFAGAGLLLALATVAASAQQQQQQPQPQRECFMVVMNHSTVGGSLGAILIDRCTGKTWQLVRVNLRGGATTTRWFPITVETTEAGITSAN